MLYKILQTFIVESELCEPMLIRWWRKKLILMRKLPEEQQQY
jgi:hypothetical protein